jgi:hypothetical protein
MRAAVIERARERTHAIVRPLIGAVHQLQLGGANALEVECDHVVHADLRGAEGGTDVCYQMGKSQKCDRLSNHLCFADTRPELSLQIEYGGNDCLNIVAALCLMAHD